MQRVLIYDSHRVPKHWMELLHPGQFAVFLQDVRSAVLIDSQGKPFAESGSAGSCYLFDSLEEARQFCLELVERRDHVRCDIYDERGMAVEPLYTFVKKRYEHLVGSKTTARRLMIGGAGRTAEHARTDRAGHPEYWLRSRGDLEGDVHSDGDHGAGDHLHDRAAAQLDQSHPEEGSRPGILCMSAHKSKGRTS